MIFKNSELHIKAGFPNKLKLTLTKLNSCLSLQVQSKSSHDQFQDIYPFCSSILHPQYPPKKISCPSLTNFSIKFYNLIQQLLHSDVTLPNYKTYHQTMWKYKKRGSRSQLHGKWVIYHKQGLMISCIFTQLLTNCLQQVRLWDLEVVAKERGVHSPYLQIRPTVFR